MHMRKNLQMLKEEAQRLLVSLKIETLRTRVIKGKESFSLSAAGYVVPSRHWGTE